MQFHNYLSFETEMESHANVQEMHSLLPVLIFEKQRNSKNVMNGVQTWRIKFLRIKSIKFILLQHEPN